ncbi:glycosyltransferase family protein [bacterium]|nr:glycosyltransferase family protein [bacterium]
MAQQFIVVTTGNKLDRLKTLELGLTTHLASRGEVEFRHLGHVANLAKAYQTAIYTHDAAESILLFCHQDARPLLGEQGVSAPPNCPPWLEDSFSNPTAWLDIALPLLTQSSTGIVGVAGSMILEQNKAWWQHGALSGAVMHLEPDGNLRMNPYGPFGQVSVVDGLIMMVRKSSFDLINQLPPLEDTFHFYDMDLCLRSDEVGLKNWTVPLLMLHESGGAAVDNEDWQKDHEVFLARWGDCLPKVISEGTLGKKYG